MTAVEKIQKAKIQLILTEPFFATVALSLVYIEDVNIETACTDGHELRYNPKFIDDLSPAAVKGLLAHEVMHITCLHHTRRGARAVGKWNKAADFAINQMLKDTGFDLPAGGCLDAKYKGMSAEEIYSQLPNEPEQKDKNGKGEQGENGNDPGGDGGVKDAPAKSKADLQRIEAETKQLVAQAATIAKQRGKLPGHLERLVSAVLEAKVNWKDVLNDFITAKTRNDYTFAKPSKRYISSGIYLPSLESVERGKFVLAVDTSGSIDVTLLNQFAGEMQSILADVSESITVIFADAKVKAVQEFESDEPMTLKPKGGGGTDFKPAFKHVAKTSEDCAAFVYFTDGICNSFPEDPGYPVLWAVHDNKTFAPPFGEVINID